MPSPIFSDPKETSLASQTPGIFNVAKHNPIALQNSRSLVMFTKLSQLSAPKKGSAVATFFIDCKQ